MTPSPARRTFLAGLAAAGLVGPASAWDVFHKPCDKGCTETQRVTLPTRQVEVVSEQPRVVVRESAPRTRTVTRSAEVGAIPVGNLYLPMAMPMVGMGMPFGGVAGGATREVREVVEAESNPLEAIHRAEVQAFRAAQHEDQLQRIADLHSQSVRRLRAVRGAGGGDADRAGAETSAAITTRLNAIDERLNKLTQRVDSVEKLLIYHDNYITGNRPAAGGATMPATTPPAKTTPEPDTTPATNTQPSKAPPPTMPPAVPPKS